MIGDSSNLPTKNFDCLQTKTACFSSGVANITPNRSSVGGSKYLLPTCPTPEEESLRFESRFESGNLAKAIKITANYYELYLRTDLYTNRHMQWFYFRITNMKKGCLYRFSLVNFTKEDSLYSDGMKPLMYSEKDAQLHSIGWRRCGANITYFSNECISTPEDPDPIQYYTLSFTIEFPHDYDTVYFAHSYPYTYSDLQDYLMQITTHPIKSSYTTLRLLCKTLAGNNVYYITVTTPTMDDEEAKRKKAIVITARVHPGETPSSWMMHGFLDYLTSDCAPAKELRDKFIFKLVPMLNPDGVIVGNNRCSLSGRDLNRQYRTVVRETYPSIWYTKLMIRRLLEECGVAMYCDLHAHSKKHNIFIFGCENRRATDKKLFEQVFPLMLHKNTPDRFSFQNCKFKVQKCKEGTGRVVMYMMGIANSFTMEASFGGSTLGNRNDTHFNTNDFEQMGKTFCQTLIDFYDDDPKKERLRTKIISRLMKEGSNAEEPANICISDYSSDDGDTSCSDAEDRGGEKRTKMPTSAPPPSPVKIKRCIVPKLNVPKINLKSPTRRSADVSRTATPMNNVLKSPCSSDYSSDTESESPNHKKSLRKKKKKKKKKQLPKKQTAFDFSDNDLPVTIIELPLEKYRKNQPSQRRDFIIPKCLLDSRRSSQVRLSDMQVKLMSLKNKLWFGIGDVNNSHNPLSWENPNLNKSNSRCRKSNEKRKVVKKLSVSKEDSRDNKQHQYFKSKLQQPSMQKDPKKQTAAAIEFNANLMKVSAKLRKSKSLTDNTKKEAKYGKYMNLGNGDPKVSTEIGPSGSKVKQKKSKTKPKICVDLQK